jgi:hypothetical protein
MSEQDIKQKMQSGDWKTVGQLLGITPNNAAMAFRRSGKRHDEVVATIEKIITNREKLLRG